MSPVKDIFWSALNPLIAFVGAILAHIVQSPIEETPRGVRRLQGSEFHKRGAMAAKAVKGEVQSRITINSKERIKISLQIGAKIMKIG